MTLISSNAYALEQLNCEQYLENPEEYRKCLKKLYEYFDKVVDIQKKTNQEEGNLNKN